MRTKSAVNRRFHHKSSITPNPNDSSYGSKLPRVSYSVSSPHSLKLMTSRKVIAMVCASSRELEMSNLTALSPLDGRFWRKFKELASSMSEFRLIYFRALDQMAS
ncbi:uncharacterized protein LOC9316934 isoform X2 [Arabidopsis lyrata subsp. lyrata]|uniref:uncharacterized protein LOC9316934 isoform X2 n=1 Tax=Arabidopsis lyrata subsp. lyrata TaxID=81972 RepID=UPI000A29C2A5|nr:uncharacterized protein LOC9316934 isoform X2 [Arabidopsis lyrata subsp. lyrata]|eukprot:XP_020883031.1 uncharacterized protein LOC9316934 isoform X2 [Arabidopsis lyrata subsp. lyrata]